MAHLKSALVSLLLIFMIWWAPLAKAVATPAASPTAERTINLVAIGDSIPFADFCTTCEHAFVDDYAMRLEDKYGLTVHVDNRSRNDSAKIDDIIVQLASENSLRQQIRQADIVLISIGFNNQPPFDSDQPCGGSPDVSIEEVIGQIAELTSSCMSDTIAQFQNDYQFIFSEIAELAPDHALLLSLSPYDSFNGWPGFKEINDQDQVTAMETNISWWFHHWNPMECDAAQMNGFQCVDLYAVFNGPDGTEPAGDLLEPGDYTHPSKAGNATIADLLIAIPVTFLEPQGSV